MASVPNKKGSNSNSISNTEGKNILGNAILEQVLTESEITDIKTNLIDTTINGTETEDIEIIDSIIENSFIEGTPIGNISASTGNFTTLKTSGVVNISNTTVSSNYNNGALVVAGGIGVAGTSRFKGNLYADKFIGCGRHIHNILGENVLGNVTAEPNYLIIKVNQHCVNPPNISTGINAVGIGNSHYVKGTFSIISGGLRSNLDGKLSSINGGYENKIYKLGNSSVISGGYQNIITKGNSSIIGEMALAQ